MEKSGSTDSLKMRPDEGTRGNGTFCLTTAYLAPVSYYAVLAQSDCVWLEQHEHYQRQSYRNRCRIVTANGVMDLTVPVERLKGAQKGIREVRISNHGNWALHHWKSLESAYLSSPFFEYYADDLLAVYRKRWSFLWDLNLALQEVVLDLLDVPTKVRLTEVYGQEGQVAGVDLRARVHPKVSPAVGVVPPYYQVFADRQGFHPDVSVVDLLCNMGNEAVFVLQDTDLQV